MKQKHIDASREARLWIGQVIVPAVTLALAISPELREKAVSKAKELSDKFTNNK